MLAEVLLRDDGDRVTPGRLPRRGVYAFPRPVHDPARPGAGLGQRQHGGVSDGHAPLVAADADADRVDFPSVADPERESGDAARPVGDLEARGARLGLVDGELGEDAHVPSWVTHGSQNPPVNGRTLWNVRIQESAGAARGNGYAEVRRRTSANLSAHAFQAPDLIRRRLFWALAHWSFYDDQERQQIADQIRLAWRAAPGEVADLALYGPELLGPIASALEEVPEARQQFLAALAFATPLSAGP